MYRTGSQWGDMATSAASTGDRVGGQHAPAVDVTGMSTEAVTDLAITACVDDNPQLLESVCTQARALSAATAAAATTVFDPNAADEDGDTPVHYAVSCGSLRCLKLLLDVKADATRESSDGSNCLHIAAQYGLVEFVKPLLRCNIAVDDAMPDGSRALDIAMLNRQAKFAHKLMTCHCDVTYRNEFTDEGPLWSAFDANLLGVFAHLLKCGALAVGSDADDVFADAETDTPTGFASNAAEKRREQPQQRNGGGGGGDERAGGHRRRSLIGALVEAEAYPYLDAIAASHSNAVGGGGSGSGSGCVWNAKESGFPLFFNALYQPGTDALRYVRRTGQIDEPVTQYPLLSQRSFGMRGCKISVAIRV